MKTLKLLIKPILQKHWFADLIFALIRFFCGITLAFYFGAGKFGMPWTPKENNLELFQVATWFTEDVAEYGGLFTIAPLFFAWMGAFSEAIGGILFAFGIKTRITALLIICTMLVAVFFQKFDKGLWSMLPAISYIWVAVYHLYFGSGRFGFDFLISEKLKTL